MFYMPINGEVDLTPLALSAFEQGKSVCVPKLIGIDMSCRRRSELV